MTFIIVFNKCFFFNLHDNRIPCIWTSSLHGWINSVLWDWSSVTPGNHNPCIDIWFLHGYSVCVFQITWMPKYWHRRHRYFFYSCCICWWTTRFPLLLAWYSHYLHWNFFPSWISLVCLNKEAFDFASKLHSLHWYL